jgi:DNA sulfur modification protein DndB
VKVHRSASMLAVEKNLTRDEDNEVEPWDCLHLIEYYEIVTKDHAQWQEIFAASYTRPEDLGGQGAWKSKASWMVEVNRIRNENDHTYSVKESEFQFLTSIREWLKGSR